ncbi:MAG: hypothetical protein A2653_01060 [Candidatus Zambryskibacteria bacterium RIFCSPHIGHO2_01_FULL_43_25]|uniref:Hydrolase TatD n=1 Tax=Candidatus Zambryskibacteria bacterium RIFCSPLOWO2_01_FULL_45_21 TaxID=1802761 RepID=A0A1G2U4H2_9BACT|nr:MAG: hypothetical protein A2653_01060 [Candidatus Zambryskibacteria bacterium RIFCSPHIGHO2_01_FULL_43_25]OHB00899.1 MAG: hypothetical protein A3E94_01445 [Candidatus Zambryskibacteria bacterium RIFCSPHIGHO2_12_FULL_44_12b]OHB04379.1 MAG: hypothetical protein A3B14_01875 [Candidatus Zambryskibacteria bacterium RIFCSPLOWO2_01_FULL_45_21]
MKKPNYFDVHSHLNFPQYDVDREEAIARMEEGGVSTITVGTDAETSRSAVDLSKKSENLFATIGIHPDGDLAQWNDEFFRSLISHPKVVGVGECGFDYARTGDSTTDKIKNQKELFSRQIELALEFGKPLMVHCRNAYEDVYDVLLSYSRKYGDRLSGDMHFFAADVATAKKFLDINFFLSFTGVVTFASSYEEVVKFAPLDRILAETDSPFVTPIPHRGKRNEPIFVEEVVKKISAIRNSDFETTRKKLVDNALLLFSIRTD